MNCLAVLCEGAADRPIKAFGHRTPLQVARLPASRDLAKAGRCGLVAKRSQNASSLLYSFLGLDTDVRRAPCEWAGIDEAHDGSAFILHGTLVTAGDGVVRDARPTLSFEETRLMAEGLEEGLETDAIKVRAVSSGELVLAMYWSPRNMPELAPPNGIEGRRLADQLAGTRQAELRELVARASALLTAHPANDIRIDLGENPANGLWLWGGGWSRESRPAHAGSGVVLAGSPWVRGAARLAGWEVQDVRPMAGLDGDRAAFDLAPLVARFRALKKCLLYVDSPIILGNFHDSLQKVRALDQMDFYLIRHLRTLMDASRPMRFTLVADGMVRSDTGTPVSSALPIAVLGDGLEPDPVDGFNEADCARGGWGTLPVEAACRLAWNES